MAGVESGRIAGRIRLIATYALIAVLLWRSRPSTINWICGGLFVVLGEGIRIWAAGHLKKTTQLITSGPYRHTRNPLYLGRILIFTGLCLAAGWWALILMVPGYAVFFLYYMPRKERIEPARLLEHHGEAYRRYRSEVPALFPALRPYAGGDSATRWSIERMTRNREHWMILGLLGALIYLAWRAVSGSAV